MSEQLNTEINVQDPDGFYAELIDLHEGLSTEQSLKANAKLILMLANHIGDREVLNDVVSYVRANI